MRWLESLRKRVAVLLSAGFILATATASFAAVTVQVNTDKVGGGVVYGAWSIDGGTTWNTGGSTVTGAAGAGYTITFGDVPGYTKPADIATGALVDPQAYSTTGSYTAIANPGNPEFGVNAITVNIVPAQAVTDGAQWSLDGGTTWLTSGDTVSGPSSYTITYKTVAGWRKPASVTGSTTTPTLTGVYKHVISDFDGDANSDIVFRNGTSGHVYLWTNMNGGTVGAGGYTSASPGTTASPGTIVGQGDFDGDGKSDLLFEDTGTKDLTVWLMNGTDVVSTSNLMTVAPAITRTATEVVGGVSDFNGDGKDDILLIETNSSGALTPRIITGIDGTKVSTNVSVTIPQTSAAYGNHTGWHVAALGDFDADGKSDILWRFANQTTVGSWVAGQTSIWYMNGATRSSGGQLPGQLGAYQNTTGGATPTGWLVVGTGDFDGDGYTDLFYRYAGGGSVTTGTTAMWLLTGQSGGTPTRVANGTDTATIVNGQSRGSGKIVDLAGTSILNGGAFTAGGGWHVIAVGDYNSDGKDDILWRYMGTGHTYVWTMNGRTATATAFTSVYPGSAAGAGWNAQIMRTVLDPQ